MRLIFTMKVTFLKGKRGFTLVETLISVALIGGLVVIGVPMILQNLASTRLARTAREVKVELNAAGHLAVSRNMRYRINFTLSAYPTLDTYTRSYYTGGSWVVDSAMAPRSFDSIVDMVSPTSNFTVEFRPNNSATANHAICLQNTSDATNKYLVSVFSTTGRVTISEGGC